MPTGSERLYLKKVLHPVYLAGKLERHLSRMIKTSNKQRHKTENMFCRIKDWRRIAMRYDRCAHTFLSAICIAVIVIFHLN